MPSTGRPSDHGFTLDHSHMLRIETLHHVSLPITDLSASRTFYSNILGLEEVARPNFNFPGAWFAVGDRVLHLIVGEHSTLRKGKDIDSHDAHFAIRVTSYRGALDHLRAKGYSADATDPLRRLRENPGGKAGFPQIYLLDPDHNVVEINAAVVD